MTPRETREHKSRLAKLRMVADVRARVLAQAREDLERAKLDLAKAENACRGAVLAVTIEEVAPDVARLPDDLRERLRAVAGGGPLSREDEVALARRGLMERHEDWSWPGRGVYYRYTSRGDAVRAALRAATAPTEG